MQSRTVRIRTNLTHDGRRQDALVGLLALALGRYLEALDEPVDFVPRVRVYPDVDVDDEEARRW